MSLDLQYTVSDPNDWDINVLPIALGALLYGIYFVIGWLVITYL